MTDLQVWEDDPALYVFTSLTAGSSHIVTATSRIETILRANRIPFSYIDTATNDSAKMLYQRRGKGKKLPFLVKEGFVIGDLEQVEEWNEFGEVKEAIGPVATKSTSITTTPAKNPATSSKPANPSTEPSSTAAGSNDSPAAKENLSPSMPLALRQAAFETASAAKEKKLASSKPAPLSSSSSSTSAAPITSPKSAAPLTPSKVPLPATPSAAPLKSPRSGISSPHPASPGHRHTSSSGSLSQQFVPDHYEPAPTSHRGSSVSLASEEEIREIECSQTIVEENEDEDEDEDEEDTENEEPIVIPAKKAEADKTAEKKDTDVKGSEKGASKEGEKGSSKEIGSEKT